MTSFARRATTLLIVLATGLTGHFATLRSGTTVAGVHPAKPLVPLLLVQTEDPTVTSEWAGVWQSNEDTYNCETQALSSSDVVVDTLCTGAAVLGLGDDFTCTGTITATDYDVHCTAVFSDVPGCTVNVDVRGVGTRDGDSAESTTVMQIWFTGCSFPSACDSIVAQSTRIAPELETCTTPVEPLSWGALKSRFDR